jgi:hypothetical protein
MGCPHMTLKQLEMWTERVENGLKESGNKKVLVPTVFKSLTKPSMPSDLKIPALY